MYIDIEKFKSFLIKEGFTKDGPLMRAHLELLENYTSRNKGNPVPSIDNKETKMLQEAIYGYINRDKIDKNRIKDFSDLFLKLQNGVETDNEQPKCNECKCSGDTPCMCN
jgi:hypothetical protein